MKNAAIVLAVSDYQNVDCLPGCISDAQLIKSLLEATEKYNEFLFIAQDTESLKVKDKLAEFIASHKDKIFNEVFFY